MFNFIFWKKLYNIYFLHKILNLKIKIIFARGKLWLAWALHTWAPLMEEVPPRSCFNNSRILIVIGCSEIISLHYFNRELNIHYLLCVVMLSRRYNYIVACRPGGASIKSRANQQQRCPCEKVFCPGIVIGGPPGGLWLRPQLAGTWQYNIICKLCQT